MKRILTLCLLAVTMCAVAQEQTQAKRIAILETVDKTDKVDYAYELQLRQSLTFAINRTPGYKGYSRLDMAQINSEHNFQRTGFVSDADIKKLGQMAGAAYVLIAEVTPYNGGKLMILANLVNVESGEYENSTPPITSAMDDVSMTEACKKIAQILLNVSGNVSSNNHNTQSVEEIYQLGENYYYGENSYNQDYSQAVYWYRKAAEQGYADAQYSLGYCYDNGEGVTQDYSQAVYWYRKAAEQGHVKAQNNLGEIYYNREDYSQAVYWYRIAAENNHAASQYSLGWCYYFGEGVTQNKQTSLYWMRKGASQSDEDAIKFIKEHSF